jgi:hypothetical protein
MGTEQYDAAVSYACAGWRIFPLHTPQGVECSCGKRDCKIGKHPRISNWQNDASSDPATAAKWWSQWPDANIGMCLDGLVVLDVDPRHDGFESLTVLENEHGALDLRARQQSGSGGWHYLFESGEDVKMARGFARGLDLLAGSGGYIVVAPSVHSSGGRYEWTEEPHPMSSARDTIALTTPPQWLLAVAAKGQPKTVTRNPRPVAERVPVDRILAKAVAKVREGAGRNDTGLAFFTQMRDNRYSRDESALALMDWVTAANEATPGQDRYTQGEAEDTLHSAYSRPAREPWQQTGDGMTQELVSADLKQPRKRRF